MIGIEIYEEIENTRKLIEELLVSIKALTHKKDHACITLGKHGWEFQFRGLLVDWKKDERKSVALLVGALESAMEQLEAISKFEWEPAS